MEKQGYAPVVDNPLEPPEDHSEVEELAEFELNEIVSRSVRVLWAHRRTMMWFIVCGLVISLIMAFIIPKSYQSTVRLMPPDNPGNSTLGLLAAMSSSNSSGGGGGGLGMAASLLGGKSPGDLFIEILASSSVLNNMIDRFDLRKEYGVTRYEDARLILLKNTEVGASRKSGIITITVTARSPDRARDMASGYIDELTKVVNRVSTGSAGTERKFLEQRLAALGVELGKSAQEFSAFASKNTALDIPEQAKASLTAAARLQAELATNESELRGLEQVYTDSNVRVRQLRGRVAELRRQTQSSDSGDTTGAGGDSLGQMMRNLPKLGVTYAELFRKFTINEKVYEALTTQYEIAKVQEAKEIPPVNVLDPANYPERKSSPHRSLVLLFGLIFSAVLGAAWILGSDSWENLDPANPVKILVGDKWNEYAGKLRSKRSRTEASRQSGSDSMSGGDPSGNGNV